MNRNKEWTLAREEIRHECGATQLVLVLETMRTINVDGARIVEQINSLPAEAIGLTELSESQRGFLSSNLSGVLKRIF